VLPTFIDYVGDGPDIMTRLHFSQTMDTSKVPPMNLFTGWLNGVPSTFDFGVWTDIHTFTLAREKGYPPTLWEFAYAGGNVNFVTADGSLVAQIVRQTIPQG
jgi:hypothetical protein